MFEGMTNELFARIIADSVKTELIPKYMAGAVEHKDNGHLWTVPLPKVNEFAIEEAIDQAVYLITMRRQFQALSALCKDLFAEIEMLEEPLSPNAQALAQQIKALLGL